MKILSIMFAILTNTINILTNTINKQLGLLQLCALNPTVVFSSIYHSTNFLDLITIINVIKLKSLCILVRVP